MVHTLILNGFNSSGRMHVGQEALHLKSCCQLCWLSLHGGPCGEVISFSVDVITRRWCIYWPPVMQNACHGSTCTRILNTLADDLSRDCVSSFLLQAPNMPTRPAPLPLMATDLLLDPAMDWSSLTWISLFASILH